MAENYYHKYLKYKNKYNILKKQYGGIIECSDAIFFFNSLLKSSEYNENKAVSLIQL